MSKTHLTFKKYEPYFSFFLDWKKNNPSTWEKDRKILALLAVADESITPYMLHRFSNIEQDYIEHLLKTWHKFLETENFQTYKLNSMYLRDFVKHPIATGMSGEAKQLKRELSQSFEEANRAICNFYIAGEELKRLESKNPKNENDSTLLNYALDHLIHHLVSSHFSEKEFTELLSKLMFDVNDYNLWYKIKKSHSQQDEYKNNLDEIKWKIHVMLEKKEGNSTIEEDLKRLMEYYLEIALLKEALRDKTKRYSQDKPIYPFLKSKYYLLEELIDISYKTHNITLFLKVANEFCSCFSNICDDEPAKLEFNVEEAIESIKSLQNDYVELVTYKLLIEKLRTKRRDNAVIKDTRAIEKALEDHIDYVNNILLLSQIKSYMHIGVALHNSDRENEIDQIIEKTKKLVSKVKNIFFHKDDALLLFIELLVKTGRVNKALRISRHTRIKLTMGNPLERAIRFLLNKGELDKAIKLSNIMEDSYIKSSSIYPYIVVELLKEGRIRKALNLMLKDAKDDYEESEILVVVLHALIREGFVDDALKALFTNEKPILDVFTREAIKLIKETTSRAEQLKEYLNQSEIYSYIAERLAELGYVDEAVRVLSEKVDVKTVEVDTCNMIIHNLLENNRKEDANKIADEAVRAIKKVRRWHERAEGLSSVAGCLALLDREKEAKDMIEKLNKLVERMDKSDDDYYRSDAYVAYAYRLAEVGRMDEAIRIAESLRNNGFRADTYFGIADIFMKKDKIEEAIDVIELIDYSYFQSESYAYLVKKLIELNSIVKALKMTNRIEYISYRVEAYKALSDYFINTNNLDKALKLAENIKFNLYRSKIYSHISKRLAEKNEIQKAVEVTERIDANYYKAKNYFEISNILSNNGNIENAIEMMKKAEKIRIL